jgi:hypothetical protein
VRSLRGSIGGVVALLAQAVGGAGCGHYEEAVTDPTTAVPQRPEAASGSEVGVGVGVGVGVIAGEVRVESLAASIAVTFETVGLFREGTQLATTTTDAQGRFRFDKGEGAFFDDGAYELTLLSDRYRASSRIQYARFARRSYPLIATRRGSP